MDSMARHHLAQEALDGYVHGPTAATEATAQALAKTSSARAIILVEGISDQIAVETLAHRHGRDLEDEHVVVFPIGGAQAIARYLQQFGPAGENRDLAGLCDASEEKVFRRGLYRSGVGASTSRTEMGSLGFHVCVEDLEDELIRAVGTSRAQDVFESQGDLGSFRTLQMQPAWEGRDIAAQMRRFLGAGAKRKLRYAKLFVDVVDLDRIPHPLDATLEAV